MKGFGSLYSRLALVMLGMFGVAALLLAMVFYHAMDMTQNETSQKLHFGVADYVVGHSGAIKDGKFDQANIKKAFENLMLLGPATELYVLDTQGRVQAYDAPEEKIIHRQVNTKPIERFLNTSKNSLELPILGDDPRSDRQKVFSAAPIKDTAGTVTGYLYIILEGEEYEAISNSLRHNQTLQVSFLGMGLGLAFLLLTALVLFYAMTRPLKQLSREIQAFEASGFTELPASSRDMPQDSANEIVLLHHSFRRMGEKIMEQLDNLKKHDQIRREFLAYVSHDLRTPLAGIRAYLETLSLKGDGLPAAKQQEFISKAIVNSDRLTKMIADLFDLARLDNSQVGDNPLTLAMDTLPIADLLSDLYAAVAPVAENKGVKLVMDCPDMGLTVHADIAQLGRVLQNLTENALRYTPAGGQVAISAKPAGDARNLAEIAVRDTGPGISEADLPWIFQPYYRCGRTSAQHREGAGLGLTISQRILALHGAELTVRNVDGGGAVFTFRLPMDG